MNIDQLKGFIRGMEANFSKRAPNAKQWERIKEEINKLEGKEKERWAANIMGGITVKNPDCGTTGTVNVDQCTKCCELLTSDTTHWFKSAKYCYTCMCEEMKKVIS